MTQNAICTHFGSALAFLAALTVGEPRSCDAGRASAEEASVKKAAQHERKAVRTVGIKLDENDAEKGLNGSYSDGRRTLRFETVRQPIDRRGAQPPLERDYYISLRVLDSTGRTLLFLSEAEAPSQWLREAQPAPGRERPIEPEMFRLALEAAQAVKQLKLPRDLQPEQALLAQQLADFGAHPFPMPLRQPPGKGRGRP